MCANLLPEDSGESAVRHTLPALQLHSGMSQPASSCHACYSIREATRNQLKTPLLMQHFLSNSISHRENPSLAVM